MPHARVPLPLPAVAADVLMYPTLTPSPLCCLQSPLQPLQDNLESQTYETFERDGTKYTTYEEAVYRCLLDRVPQARANHCYRAPPLPHPKSWGGGAGWHAAWRQPARRRQHTLPKCHNPHACLSAYLGPWRFPCRRRLRAASRC